MADYNANIKVNADTRAAERSLSQLEQALNRLSTVKTDIGGGLQARIKDVQNEAASLGKSFQRLGGLIKNAAYAGGFTALSATVLDLTAQVSNLGSLIPGIGSKFAAQSAAATASLGTLQHILGGLSEAVAAVGGPENAAGIAAITTALVAFGPQIARAAIDTEKLGAALGTLAPEALKNINPIADAVTQLNTELNATASSFENLIAGSTLNQLNAQLRDAVEQTGAFHSSTTEAVTAAQQLVAVTKAQAAEQRAINDLVRKAKGITQTELEESKAIKSLQTRRKAQEYLTEELDKYNLEIDEYNRLALEAAAATKQWEQSLKAVNTAAKTGVLGRTRRLRQEREENERSAAIARERSAMLLGNQYTLGQVPAGGELFPGGRTETASSQYRAMLNEQARIRQAASTALAQSERTLIGLQAQTLRTEKDITAAKQQQQSVDERSIQILREQNQLLLEQYRIEQRAATGALDPGSLRADRKRRVEQGRARQRRTRQATENVLIGGAFPLLFGGGPGAVLGGAAGGLIPGSPMLSVVTSALGTVFDQFAETITTTGKALNTPIEAFEELAEKGLLASKSQEKYIQKLIEAGKVNEAAAVIQGELVKKIGAEGVRDLQNAGVASDKFNKTMAELSIQVQAAVAGPLTEFLTFVNALVSSVTAANRQQAELRDFGAALTETDPAAFRQYLAESRALAQKTGGVVDPSAVKQLQQKYIQKFNLTPGAVTSNVDQTAAQQAAAQTAELQKQADLAGIQLSLVGLTLEKDGARYIAAAKAVAQQEYDNKLLEIKNSWIGKIFDKEKNLAMIRKANLELAAKNKQIDIEITQNAEMREKSALSAEAALYQQAERILLFAVKAEEFRAGEEASLTKALSLHQAIGDQRKAALEVERTLALQEAAKNGTTQQVIRLYDLKLTLLEDELELEKAVTQTRKDRLALDKAIAKADALRQAAAPFTDLQRNRELEQQYAKTYLRLVTEGMLPAEAERIANFEKLVAEQLAYTDQQIEVVEQQILLTEATITEAEARGVAVDKLKEQLDLLKQQRGVIEGRAAAGPGEGLTDRQRLETVIADVKGQLNELIDPVNQLVAAADAIGTAFADSFKGIISGAMTAQEALASFFQSLADHFLDMAAQIIAKWIQMAILNSVLQLFPGGSTGTSSNGMFGKGAPTDTFAGGGIFSGAGPYKFPGKAAGGSVSSGTPYMVGERGPELFVPGRSGTIVPNHSLGGATSVVVNVDATGSKVQGNDQDAKQLGVAISTAIRQELIKQKRPGGLLA